MKNIQNKKIKKICKIVKKRIKNKLKQSGGIGPHELNFDTSGDFSNLIIQMAELSYNIVAGVVDGVNASFNILKLPGDFVAITNKPSEPLPSNTVVSKLINII